MIYLMIALSVNAYRPTTLAMAPFADRSAWVQSDVRAHPRPG